MPLYQPLFRILIASGTRYVVVGGVQLVLEFSESEKRQRAADIASWRTRLARLDRDLETEPARIREFCAVFASRVEPIGLVYLWPDAG